MRQCTMIVGVVGLMSVVAVGQTIQPPFNANYVVTSLGTPASVPAAYGGVTLKRDDPNTMLIGGNANLSSGAIYAVPMVRDFCGQLSAFGGPGVLFASCPNIDGGLTYAPNGVLVGSRYSNNGMHQFLPGATSPTRTTDFSPLGMESSTGALTFVPEGFPGAGRFKVVIFNTGAFYDVTMTLAPNGTYDASNPVLTARLQGGPEGIAYVPAGSPGFPVPSMIVAEYSAATIAAYEINANGDPIVSTRRVFMTGVAGAEGAYIDPATGDFIFSTFGGGNQVLIVRGFAAVDDCDSIDFNNDQSVFDPQDVEAFLSVYGEGPCVPETATCNDIDFDNNGSCFDPQDIDVFLRVYGEGPCSI